MIDVPDRELVHQVVADRSEPAFRELYRRHSPILFRMAAHLGTEAADNAVHDTWLRAHDRLAGFEWRSSLRTWLTGILINVIREARRAAEREALVPLPDDLAATAVPIDDRLDLAHAVAQLPFGYRTAIVMHDVEGFSHEDIALTLGVTVGTSKSQLSRARRTLRRWLDPDWSAP